MMYEEPRPREERSLGELFSELGSEIAMLVRQEAALAKAEISQKAASVGRDLGMMVAGGLVAYAGLLAVLAAVILMLIGVGVTPWLAALGVGILVVAGGALLAMTGLQALKRADLTPRETIDALKEDRGGNHIRSRAARPS